MENRQGKHVFVSHSSKDAQIANALCTTLEEHGITCWIAPRDIHAGDSYPSAIVKGIETSRAFAIIVSLESNQSPHVLRELQIASSRHIHIYPVRTGKFTIRPEFEYFLSLSQWLTISASDPATKASFAQLAGWLLDESPAMPAREPEPHSGIQLKGLKEEGLPRLVTLAPYPIALGIQDVIEQELSPESKGLDTAVFRLAEVYVRFSTIVLISAYRLLGDNHAIPAIDELIPAALHGHRPQWVRLLDALSARLGTDQACFPLAREHGVFLSNGHNIEEITQILALFSEKLPGLATRLDKSKPIMSFLQMVQDYEAWSLRDSRLRIPDASSLIKECMRELIGRAPFLSYRVSGVKSFSPDRAERTFHHEMVDFVDLAPCPADSPLVTRDWDIYEPGHVLVRSASSGHRCLDLYPFLSATDDFNDLLMWERSEDLSQFVARRLSDGSSRDLRLESDAFFMRIKSRSLNLGSVIDSGHAPGLEEIADALAHARKSIEEQVSNPACKADLGEKLRLMEEQLIAQLEKAGSIDIKTLVDRINQLQIYAGKGSYARLKPTSKSWILKDEYDRRYIEAKQFWTNHPELKGNFTEAGTLVKKSVSDETSVLLYLALEESRSLGQKILGVEHIAIALAKLCNRILLDWYDAIGVAPRKHRDIIRVAILLHLQSLKGGSSYPDHIVKPRAQQVLDMAVDEAKLAKREQVSIIDIFSAILREGYSLPVVLLTEVFALSRDRLLSEFYGVLRRVG